MNDIEVGIKNLAIGSDGERNNAAEKLEAILKRKYSVENLYVIQSSAEISSVIAATLCRAMFTWPNYYATHNLTPRIIGLCDSTFPKLFAEVGISKKDQTFESEPKLQAGYNKIKQEALEIQQRIRTLPDAAAVRSPFMKLYNSARFQAFVAPFLSTTTKTLIQSRDIFENITDYASATSFEKITAEQRVRQSLAPLVDLATNSDSEDERMIIGQFFKTLYDLIVADLAADSSLERAEIKLEPAKRKYPLREPGCHFNIGLVARNDGPGVAFNLIIEVHADLPLRQPTVLVQQFPKGSELLSIPATANGSTSAEALFRAAWQNADGTAGESEGTFALIPQEQNADWASVDADELYSVEAVTSQELLIGRKSDLDALIVGLKKANPSSFYIHGQKRVGKTSIARTVKSILEADARDTRVVYTEGGDFRRNSAIESINALVDALIDGLGLEPRMFPGRDGSLAPLNAAIKHVQGLQRTARMIFIIDEFDELPVDVYKPGLFSETLFLNLRSLSSKDGVGFLIVGSEKMAIILNQQGVQLNKYRERKVDYFDRDRDRADFVDLIRRPTTDIVEFSDEATDEIYFYSAGNPFFTKLICRHVINNAKQRRDGFVDRSDVRDAVRSAD